MSYIHCVVLFFEDEDELIEVISSKWIKKLNQLIPGIDYECQYPPRDQNCCKLALQHATPQNN